MTWLLGGSPLAKVVLFVLVAVGLGGGLLAAKAIYDRNRRREGAQDILDQINKEERDARDRSDRAAGEYRRDGGARERLRKHSF